MEKIMEKKITGQDKTFDSAIEMAKSEINGIGDAKRYIVSIVNEDASEPDCCMVSGSIEDVFAMFAAITEAIMKSIVRENASLNKTKDAMDDIVDVMNDIVAHKAADVLSDVVTKAFEDPDRFDEVMDVVKNIATEVLSREKGE